MRITDILDESEDTPIDFSDDKANGYSKYISYNSDSGALTVTKAGLEIIGALVSDSSPVDRIVKITFDIVADSKLNLKNSTNTLTNEFHFIKAQKIDDTNIESILKKMASTATLDFNNGLDMDDKKASHFDLFNGTYGMGVYTLEDTVNNNPKPSFEDDDISTINRYIPHYLKGLNEIDKATKSTTVEDEGGAGKQSYTVSYDIFYGNNFESTLTSLKFQFNLKK